MLVGDRELTSSFEQATARHPYLSGACVTVSVEDRVIHLEGTVATSLAKQALWDLAWGLRRVRDVRDDVVICRT
jgi:osmotically-inducible protein OsmY